MAAEPLVPTLSCPNRPGLVAAVATTLFEAGGNILDAIRDVGARPAIPPRRNEALVACPDRTHNDRNRVERLWGRLKEWRAVATRNEKTAASLLGVLHIAAAIDWLGN